MIDGFLKKIREINLMPGRLESVIEQSLKSPQSDSPATRAEGVMFASMALAALHLSQNADKIKLPVDPVVVHDLRQVIDAGLKDPNANAVFTAKRADQALISIQEGNPTVPSGRPISVQLPKFSR